MMVPITPINDELLLKISEVKKKTDTGVILHAGDYYNRQEQQRDEGEVLAISPTAFKHIFDGSVPIKVGDRVIFNTYVGKERKVETEETITYYRLVKDSDIKGVVNSPTEQSEKIQSEWVKQNSEMLDRETSDKKNAELIEKGYRY